MVGPVAAASVVRANATFMPTLSLQGFAQPYYSAGAYTDVKHVTDPRGATFQNDRGSNGAFHPGDAMRTMARTAPGNVFVVKVNRWFSL